MPNDEQLTLSRIAYASILETHAHNCRRIARAMDAPMFDPQGFEGAECQGKLRLIAKELEEIALELRNQKGAVK
jgi:hypothetical protein